nr:hypothetical protein [Modestobacter marinus]
MRQRDQPPDEVRPTSRHPHVGQDECRTELASGSHRVVTVGRRPDDCEVQLLVQQRCQGGPDALVVIRDDDGGLTAP